MLTPRWILLTVLVAVAVAVMVRLGFWQLARLSDRRASNAQMMARQGQEPLDAGSLDHLRADQAQVPESIWREVRVTGTYRSEDQVLVQRSNNGAPGFWVVTPLLTQEGVAVAVNRGWVPITVGDGGDPRTYSAPAGEVTVTGLVQAPEQERAVQEAGPGGARLSVLSRVDLGRMSGQVPYALVPIWVLMGEQQPAQDGPLPMLVLPPPPDDGPHLNYAGQWFIFATLTVVVFPMAVRRAARSRQAQGTVDGRNT